MYDKIIHLDNRDDKEEIQEVTEFYGLGNFNDPPDNWRKVTEEEFAKKCLMRMYTPKYHAYKQVIENEDKGKPYFQRKPSIHCHLFMFHDGTGFAMSFDYWGGKVNYYMFGCEHSYVELSIEKAREKGHNHYGKMWHVEECQKCGHVDSYDSSD